MKTNEAILNGINEIILDFYSRYGGHESGYQTYVVGKVVPNQLGNITYFRTPTTANMTLNQVRSIEMELEKQIKKFLSLYNPTVTILLEREENFEGYYAQTISVVEKMFLKKKPKEDVNAKIVPPTVRKNDDDEVARRRKDDDNINFIASIIPAII